MISGIPTSLQKHWRELQGTTGPGAQLVRGAGVALAIHVAGVLAGLATQLMLTRGLGAEQYGGYAFVLAWIAALSTVALLGYNGASVRFIPEYRAKHKGDLLRGFLLSSGTITFLTAILLALAAAVVFAVMHTSDREVPGRVFHVGLLLLPLQTTLLFLTSAVRAFKRVAAALLPIRVVKPAIVGTSVGALALLRRGTMTAELAVWLTIGATAVAIAALVPSLIKSTRAVPARTQQYRLSAWFGVSVPVLIVSGFTAALASTDVVMLGLLVGTREAGIYAVSVSIAGLVVFGMNAADAIGGPLLAEYYAKDDQRRLARVLQIGARISFGFGAVVLLMVLPFSEYILKLFGAAFIEGRAALTVLAIGQLLNCACGLVLALFIVGRRHTQAAVVLGMVALANVAANAALIPILGTVGAAIATSSATALWNLILAAMAMRLFRANPTIVRHWRADRN